MLVIVLLHNPFHDSLLHNIARGHLHSIECSRMYTWSSTIKGRSLSVRIILYCVCPSVDQVVKCQCELDRRDHDSRTQPRDRRSGTITLGNLKGDILNSGCHSFKPLALTSSCA